MKSEAHGIAKLMSVDAADEPAEASGASGRWGENAASNQRIRTLVVDDDPVACRRLCQLCIACTDLELVGHAGCGRDAIDIIRTQRPDLVLLDVRLGDLSGFEVVRASRELDRAPATVMVTTNAEHAFQAFDADVVDCLPKPVSPERLRRAIMRAKRRLATTADSTSLSQMRQRRESAHDGGRRVIGERANRIYLLDSWSIDYLRADGNYVVIHSAGEEYVSRSTTHHLTAALTPTGFLRISRSHLINLKRVAFVERLGQAEYSFTMIGGQRLVSSKRRRRAILEELHRGA